MAYNIYQDDDLIAEEIEEKEYTVDGLTPNTEYSFSVSEVIGEKESDKATIKVKTDPVAVTGVTVAPKTVTLEEGETQQLSATVAPSNATDKSVTYASKAQGIASVDDDGLVTAKVAGTAEIVVTTADGEFKDTCTVTVKEPVKNVTGVSIAPKTNNLEVGATRQLNVTIEPSDADNQDVTYKSSDDDIASVDGDGLVTANTDGEATITVTTDDGNHTDTATVNVTEPEPEPEPDPEEPEE